MDCGKTVVMVGGEPPPFIYWEDLMRLGFLCSIAWWSIWSSGERSRKKLDGVHWFLETLNQYDRVEFPTRIPDQETKAHNASLFWAFIFLTQSNFWPPLDIIDQKLKDIEFETHKMASLERKIENGFSGQFGYYEASQSLASLYKLNSSTKV